MQFSLIVATAMFMISASGFDAEVPTVVIGTQIWCTKNLDVSTYRNGDVIPEIREQANWDTITTGAWCYYKNKTANGTTYGKLYNWYAVNDSRGLAPAGYHVPSNDEWNVLTDFLGGLDVAGKKMKSKNGWEQNGNGTNSCGFNALPGGERDSDGFEDLKEFAKWWSSTESSIMGITGVHYRYIPCQFDFAGKDRTVRGSGLSVRCIKD